VQAFEDLGNPFLEEGPDLIDLDQSVMMAADVLRNVENARNIGLKKYCLFLDDRIFNQKLPFNAPIKETRIQLFGTVLRPKRATKSVAVAIKKVR
jgi:hypothetical protein